MSAETEATETMICEGNSVEAAAATEQNSSDQQPLSKNQLKKLKKKERWLQFKAEKRCDFVMKLINI